MSYPIVLLWLFGALFVLYALFQSIRWFFGQRLLRSIETMPFPKAYRTFLRRIAHYNALSSEERMKIERAVLRFIHTKEFIGIRLRIKEEMKVVVAFYACLMALYKEEECYDRVSTILLYSHDFIVDEVSENGGITTRGRFVLEGQSTDETVVLSWYEAKNEAYRPDDHNVIIHEFAHTLDFEDGVADGVPLLERAQYDEWVHLMRHEYEKLLHAMQRGKYSEKYDFLGEYATTNEAEFFAVGSERFFQSPRQLHADFPELFEALKRFYRCDPLVWGLEALHH